jgi:hypothetical protein
MLAKNRLTAAALAGLGALVVGGTLAVASGDDAATPGTNRAAVETVAPGLPTVVGAFRRDQRPDDRIPGDPVGALEAQGDLQPRESPDMARRLQLAGRQSAYAWPSSHGVCYSSPGPSGCFPTALLAQRGALLGTTYSGQSPVVRVFGLVRDGIGRVELTLENGGEVVLPVQDNAVYAEVQSDPAAARWRNPDGSSGAQDKLVRRPTS